MKNKKLLIVGLVLVFVMSITLSACGGGSGSSSTDTGSTSGGDAPATTASDDVITLKVNNFMPQETPPALGTAYACEKLEELSGGKMVAEEYYNGTLLGFNDSWQGTGAGAVDVAIIGPAAADSNTLLSNVFETPIPNLPASNVETTKIYNELIDAEPSLNEEMETQNLRWLALQSLCNSSLHMNKKTIPTIEDVKGMKVEGLGAVSSKYWESLGATTVSLDPGDYYLSAERGVIDGMFAHWPVINDYKLNEALTYHTIFGEIDPEVPNGHGLVAGAMMYVVNLDTWNKLTEEQQGWLTQAFREAVVYTAEMDMGSAKAGYDEAVAKGHEILVIKGDDLKPWYDAMNVVVDNWVEECDKAGFTTARQVYDTLLKLVESHS